MGISLVLMSLVMLMMTQKNSPMKLSLVVTMLSVFLSVLLYMNTKSIFTSCALVISFSSGMMILFCYCATLCNHEMNSSKKSTLMITLMLMSSICLSSPKMLEALNNMKASAMVTSPILLALMSMVILSMMAINLSMFNPSKKMTKMY